MELVECQRNVFQSTEQAPPSTQVNALSGSILQTLSIYLSICLPLPFLSLPVSFSLCLSLPHLIMHCHAYSFLTPRNSNLRIIGSFINDNLINTWYIWQFTIHYTGFTYDVP